MISRSLPLELYELVVGWVNRNLKVGILEVQFDHPIVGHQYVWKHVEALHLEVFPANEAI